MSVIKGKQELKISATSVHHKKKLLASSVCVFCYIVYISYAAITSVHKKAGTS